MTHLRLDIFRDYFFSGEFKRANDAMPIQPERWDDYILGEIEIEAIANVLLRFRLPVYVIERIGEYLGELRATEFGWVVQPEVID